MAHVDDGQLNALLDGELSPEAAREVEAHVATCTECAYRLNEARAFLTEAGELLTVLTPPPRVAEPVALPPQIAKTSKEIAVSVDGRTEMTPAIRPVFAHEVPAAPRRSWRLPDLEKLAWAASLVLCVGVGYLANEVYHLRQRQTEADNGRQRQTEADNGRQLQTDVAANSPGAPTAAPAERRSREPAARQAGGDAAGSTAGPSDRPSVRPSDRPSVQPSAAGERAPNAAPARPKPPVTKPAPAIAQPRPEQIASNQAPTDRFSAPAAAAPPAAAPALGSALRDVAGVAAPSPAPLAAGAGVASEGRARSLDESSVTSTSDVAMRRMAVTAFRRATMEEAVRRLSGSIRLIDGMNPSRVDIGPGRLVSGANPDREVVRVTYVSGSQRLVLDQQLGDASLGSSFNGLMPGDTLVSASGNDATQVRWIDRKFWMSLTGGLMTDSLRVLVGRIR